MNKRIFTTTLVALFALTCSLRAADASFKHWRNSMKAAEQARYKREFETMRDILEGSATEAQQLGPATSAENAYWLTIAYRQLGLFDLAIQTFNAELEKIGPKPTAIKLQILRGMLLGERGVVYYRAGDTDKALTSATEGKAVLEEVAGKFHPELYEINMTIGRIHAFRKDYGEAEKSMKTALKLAQSRQSGSGGMWSGSESQTVIYISEPAPYRIILAATDLGKLYLAEKKYDDAESAFKTGLESARAAYPKDSYMVVLPLRGLAEVEFKKGRRVEFTRDTDEIYRIVSKTPGLELVSTAALWLRFGADLDDHNAAAAIDSAKRIAKVFEFQNFDFEEFGRGAFKLATVDNVVDWKRAALIQDALANVAESYRTTDPTKAGQLYVEIADFNLAHGKSDTADAMFEQAVKSQENARDKAVLIGVLGKMAENKIAAGKKADALPLYHRVSVAMREKYGNDMRVADSMDAEARLMKELGKEQEAKDLQAQAMDFRKKIVFK